MSVKMYSVKILENARNFMISKYLGMTFVSSMKDIEKFNKSTDKFVLNRPTRQNSGKYLATLIPWSNVTEKEILCMFYSHEDVYYKTVIDINNISVNGLIEMESFLTLNYSAALINQNGYYIIVPFNKYGHISLTGNNPVETKSKHVCGFKCRSNSDIDKKLYLDYIYDVGSGAFYYKLIAENDNLVDFEIFSEPRKYIIIENNKDNVPEYIRKKLEKRLCVNKKLI